MNEQLIILDYGIKLLRDRNINYWIDCGTLLGIIRDQSLLPWDKDLDISVLRQNLSNEDIDYIVDKVKSDGLQVNVYNSCISIVKEEYVFDIKLFDQENDYVVEKKLMPKNSFSSVVGFLVHSLTSDYETHRNGRNLFNKFILNLIQVFSRFLPSVIKSLLAKPLIYVYQEYLVNDISEAVPFHFFQEFEQLEFNGNYYTVPSKNLDYLEFRYGVNWKTPNKEWITERDDGAYLYNIEINK